MTVNATSTDEFDPLDDPQVAAFYNRLRQQQGQLAADRYLLTVKPTGGMNATTPAVVTTNGRTKEHNFKAAPTLTAPLPTSRALAGSDVFTNVILSFDEAAAEAEPALKPAPIIVVTDLAPTAQGEQLANMSTAAVETAEPIKTTVCTIQADQAARIDKTEKISTIAEADRPETGVTPTAKRERKPARSTAAVKQAFEDALAAFVKADQPFRRSHVVQKAGLGASFYDRYPSLRTR
jgi:hypothetical protein